MIHGNVSALYDREGDLVGAMAQYEFSLCLWPSFPEAHANLGLVLAKQNRLSEAEFPLRRASARPRHARAAPHPR
ncbi:MAG TPA: tetratricopeptide repeat protein [Myxococcota bacterium]|nr:tetratricopeptide repeat protein [Myxococcota bacterium]